MDQKIYYHHSDYVGGMKETTLKEMMAKKPEKVIELAVKGMLPKGPLGRTCTRNFSFMPDQSTNMSSETGRLNILIGGRRHWLAQNSTEQEEERNQSQEFTCTWYR